LSGKPKAGAKQARDSFVLWVRARPRSRTDEVTGWGQDGFLEIQVKAAPERGEANRSCCRQLAGLLGIPPSRIFLEKGQASVHKKFRVVGVAQGEGEKRVRQALGQGEPLRNFAIPPRSS
jgi:uncharacterized protein